MSSGVNDKSRTTRPDASADRGTVVTGTVHPRPGRQHKNSGRQVDATLAAASSENAATGASAHAGTEAVVTGTTTIAGLESALHGDVLPCVLGITRGIDASRSLRGARMGAGEVDAEDSDLTTLRCRSRYRQTDDPAPPDHQVTPMKPHLCSHLTRLASHSNRLRMSQGLTSVQWSGTSWVACHTDCGKLCGQLSTTSREQVVECPTHRSATPTTLVPRRSIRMLYCHRR